MHSYRSFRTRAGRRPTVEMLESRLCLSITIQIDYTLDTLGFFASQARRDLLQVAADTVGSQFTDSLEAIQPSGADTWTAQFTNPATGANASLANPTIPANTILVYAGGRPSTGGELGIGGPGGYSVSSGTGDQAWLDRVASRGQAGALATPKTDFGPWGGSVAFNQSANWYFGTDSSAITQGQDDFVSVALHEMSHLLGIGTANSWFAQVSNGRFAGPNATLAYDGAGSPPLNGSGDHWADGTTDDGHEAAMDPTLLQGTRKLLTSLDFAALDDIGWDLVADTNATIATAEIRSDLNFTALSRAGMTSLPFQGIGFATDVDLYRITTDAARSVAFAASTSTYLRVFNATGVEIARTTTHPGTLAVSFPSSGVYYLGASALGNTRYSPTAPQAQLLAGPLGEYAVFYQVLELPPGEEAPITNLVVSASITSSASTGGVIIQTVRVVNIGPRPAVGVRLGSYFAEGATFVSIVASQGTVGVEPVASYAAIDSLAVGATATAEIRYIATAAGTLTFRAFALSATGDPDVTDNFHTVTTTVTSSDPIPPRVVDARVVTIGRGMQRRQGIAVTFSEDVDATSAQELLNYVLTRPGAKRRGRPAARIVVRLRAATRSNASTITLIPFNRAKLANGLQVTISGQSPGGLRDLAGNLLDGDQNGAAGGDATIPVF